MKTDLEHYRIFHVVAACSSVSRAAEKLFISQPAVSKSIKRLEEETGVTLFERNPRGVTLTSEGEILFGYVDKAIGSVEAGEKMLQKLKTRNSGSVAIGVSTTLCKHFLLPVLRDFYAIYPNIEFKIINKTTFDTLKLLNDGEVDFCIVSEPEKMPRHEFCVLTQIHDIFIAGRDCAEAVEGRDAEEVFTSSNLMLPENGNISRQYLNRYFESCGVSVKPEIVISDIETLIELVKIGMGIAAVIKEIAQKAIDTGDVVELKGLPPVPPRNIGIASLKGAPMSIAAETFIEYLKKNMK